MGREAWWYLCPLRAAVPIMKARFSGKADAGILNFLRKCARISTDDCFPARWHSRCERGFSENPRPVISGNVPWKMVAGMSLSDDFDGPSYGHLEKLLQNARDGSESSLGEILQSFRNYLLLLADEELGAEVKVKVSPSDVVQDSFLEARQDFGQFEGATPEQFHAWVRRILLNNIANVLRDFCRTARRDISRETSLYDSRQNEIADSGSLVSPSGVAIQNEELDRLQCALERLPGHYREVIHWRNSERASFADIGLYLHRSAEAARKLWIRALEMLQQELDGLNDSSSSGLRGSL